MRTRGFALAHMIATAALCVTTSGLPRAAQSARAASPTTEASTQPSGSALPSQELTKDWNKLERDYELLNRLDRGTVTAVTRDTLTVAVRRDNGQTSSRRYRVDATTKVLIAEPGEPDPGAQITVTNLLKLRYEYGKFASVDRGSKITVAWDEPDKAAFIQAIPTKYNKGVAIVGIAPLEPTPLPVPAAQPGAQKTTTSWRELENAYEQVRRLVRGTVSAVDNDVVTVALPGVPQGAADATSATRKYHVDAQTRLVVPRPDTSTINRNKSTPMFAQRYAQPSDLIPGMPVTVGWEEPDRAAFIKAMPAGPGGFSIRGELPLLKPTPLPAPSTRPTAPAQ